MSVGMRERLARAIIKAQAHPERDFVTNPFYSEEMAPALSAADAVLDALMEPDPEVLTAASISPFCWRLAITAAKSGE